MGMWWWSPVSGSGARGRSAARTSRAVRAARRVVAVALVAGAAAVVAAPVPAAAARGVRPVDLGFSAGIWALNNHGEAVGVMSLDGLHSHGFYWRAGRLVDLGTLGGGDSYAKDINDHGEVVGDAGLPDGSHHAFLWRDGHMRDLGTLGGDRSFATAINDRGEIVGYSQTVPGDETAWRAFLWRDGSMTELAGPDTGRTYAAGINDDGEIVGTRAIGDSGIPVRWRRGVMRDLSTQAGQGVAINDLGQIVIYLYGAGSYLWDRGRLTYVNWFNAQAINNHGEVAGYNYHWYRGKTTQLQALDGGPYASAYDINDNGEVGGGSIVRPDVGHACIWPFTASTS